MGDDESKKDQLARPAEPSRLVGVEGMKSDGSGSTGTALRITGQNPASGAELARLEAERPAMLARLSGKLPANTMRYCCIGCGWDKTLEFSEEEVRGLEGDLKSYKGPCPTCGGETLMPYENLAEGAEVEKYADAALRPDYREIGASMTDGVLDRLESRVLGREVRAADSEGGSEDQLGAGEDKAADADGEDDAGEPGGA